MCDESKLIALFFVCITSILLTIIVFAHMETEHYIKDGYQKCYIMGHGTEWMKECSPQLYMEKR